MSLVVGMQLGESKQNLSLRTLLKKHFPKLKEFPVDTISFELISWQRCNSVHTWFVNNIQQGRDDGESYLVSLFDLVTLLSVIESVFNKPDLAKSLLPIDKGYYADSNGIDERYWEDLKETRQKLKWIIDNKKYFGIYPFRYCGA